MEVKVVFLSSVWNAGEEHRTTFTTNGILHLDEKGRVERLVFTEPLGTEIAGVVETTIQVEEERLSFFRRGEMRMEQQFVCRQQVRGSYAIEQGCLDAMAYTHELACHWQDGLGEMKVVYDYYLSDQLVGKIDLQLQICSM